MGIDLYRALTNEGIYGIIIIFFRLICEVSAID